MPTSSTSKRKKIEDEKQAVSKPKHPGGPNGKYTKKLKAKSRRNSTQDPREPAKPRR